MKLIGITQRVESVAGRDEVRDCLDQRWGQFITELGFVPVALLNKVQDQRAYLEALNCDGFVLTGGGDISCVDARRSLEFAILNHAIERELPVFAVCRGMQAISAFSGGQLTKIRHHTGVRHKLVGEWAESRGIDNVNSYHDFSIVEENLGDNLTVLASTADGAIEAVKHEIHPWMGIMWHPEREEPFEPFDKRLFLEHFCRELP
ncbi:putative glutamine amidotransferase [Pseudidiomarina planktonica]|uniref:Putative glutamine amidotransferase n=1 Tax=Pseudidiomarina planktonica TaxID=1323738 RepID=A0A1Y6EHV8_9GAMM|nr:gamma-glutamyl-gamma-aminobutyrate hydrolase family protein [Pseudidiomarina planktonica]RUO65864.1 glutamine amidotransferase [Pseudidiomarina planktonica]SMQ62208.1 putative glutamine amidotransferase [Pseudidiomarina planktonica]